MRLPLSPANYLQQARQDLRLAIRRAWRAPGLAAAMILTIGIGLGAAAAIFSAFQAALLNPLPFDAPDRLMRVGEVRLGTAEESPTSYATLLDWRARATSFAALEGYDPMNAAVGLGEEARMLRGARVTPGFFRLLGLRMMAGREFGPDEPALAVVSDRLARTAAAGSAVGEPITINGATYRIVGVLPAAFQFSLLQDADIFVPLVPDAERPLDRAQRDLHVVGRRREGVAPAEARAQLATVMSQLALDYPGSLGGRGVRAVPLRDALLGRMKPILIGLSIAVGLLLVTMATNLALLMLTRQMARQPELTMRSALGATRTRLLRQLFVESLLLTVTGGALALLIGDMALRALLGAIPESLRIGMPYLADAGLGTAAVAGTFGAACLLAAGFGLGPALLVTRGSARAGEGRSTLARGDRRLRRGLVGLQMALTVVLLVSSGLLVVSFGRLMQRDLGIRAPEELVAARVSLSGERYQTAAAQRQFFERLVTEMAELSGVEATAVVSQVPGGGGGMTTFESVDQPRPPSLRPRTAVRIVGGDYFGTMGVPVLAGRRLSPGDGPDTPPVAVISATFAKLLGQDGLMIGRRVRLSATDETEWEVVGIVGDVQVAELDTESPPTVYLSHLQAAENRMSLVVRTALAAAIVGDRARAVVTAIDPGVPVYSTGTVERRLNESRAVFSRQFPLLLSAVFAAASLALALIALYAVCSHNAQSRRREFGIRLALGGAPSAIRRMIVSEGLGLAAAGIAVGAVVALFTTRLMRTLLFGVSADDWRVYLIVTAVALLAAFLATLRPALRAAATDPALVMREL